MSFNILSNLIITKIFSATTMYTEKNTKTQRNNRPCWAIVIKYEGETVYNAGGKQYVSNANNLVILPKGCSYEWHCTHTGHFSIIEFESETVCDEKKYLPSEKMNKIIPALNYIAKNYNKDIRNDELALLTGLSTVYFRKLFTEVLGVSPIAYVHKLRIKKAKEMLKSDYGSITDIAYSLGYLNIYDFSRAFKKAVGVSPSQYLQKQYQ